jgi:hypothetical protein
LRVADPRITWETGVRRAGPNETIGKVATIRNGSCGDALTKADVPRIIRALTELDLITDRTMIAVDDGGSVIVGLMNR